MKRLISKTITPSQGEISVIDDSLKSWAEVVEAVRKKIKRLESIAEAFERYRDNNEPFIGETVRVPRLPKDSQEA